MEKENKKNHKNNHKNNKQKEYKTKEKKIVQESLELEDEYDEDLEDELDEEEIIDKKSKTNKKEIIDEEPEDDDEFDDDDDNDEDDDELDEEDESNEEDDDEEPEEDDEEPEDEDDDELDEEDESNEEDDDELDDEFDDEDEFDEDELDEEEEIIETPKIKQINPKKDNKKENKNKKDNKKEAKVSKEKIEKIEKIAKEKSKKTKKKQNDTINNILAFLDKHHQQIYSFVAGLLIATFVAFLIWPDRIATLKNGTQPIVKVGGKTYTADDLYTDMESHYSVNLLVDEIDNDLLTKIYKEDDEMKKKIEENAQYYLNMYKQYYNYTQEEFLEKNGFANYEAFLNYLRLDYRRNKYLDEYVEKNLTDSDIQKYYDDNVYGDINTQHVLVEVKSSDEDTKKLSDEDAKKLAEEIITKLNDGTSWETIQKDYKDKITFEDLGYQSWDASLETSFMTALKEMEDKTYSKEPVKTSYGYHVIYRIDQKKKPTLKKVKDKIVEKIITERKSKDSNLLYKALISLRKEKKIKFSDTDMSAKYDAYCKQYQK